MSDEPKYRDKTASWACPKCGRVKDFCDCAETVATSGFDGDISTPEKALVMARHFAEEYKFNSDERGLMGALLGLLVYERDVTLPKVTAERDEERRQLNGRIIELGEIIARQSDEKFALSARVKELEAGLVMTAHSIECFGGLVYELGGFGWLKQSSSAFTGLINDARKARALIGKEPSK